MTIPSENQELNELLASNGSTTKDLRRHLLKAAAQHELGCDSDLAKRELGNLVQWTTADDKIFVPASHTRPGLVPGVFEIQHSPSIGIYFQRIPVKTEGLIRFPQTNSERVVREIQNFWMKEDIFREFHLAYKRGIILWGPAGSGKSSTIQLIMKDVVDRHGVVIKFTNPGLFMEGMRIFREIELKTPIVILMEDIDSILEVFSESDVLNILDGVDQVEKAVFLATTNYPERLGARILNRPSRFDKRFKIDHPNAESRMLYFNHLLGNRAPKELGIDIEKWVKDTDKFSIAHLKELFVAVVILGDDYAEAIETLESMKEIISSEDDRDRMMGFGGLSGRSYDG